MRKSISLFLVLAVLFSCKKEPVSTTLLTIKVQDKNGDYTPNASIYLYGTESDWANGTNYLYSARTDTKGEVTIELEARKYYIYVEYNCLKNKIYSNSDYTVTANEGKTTIKNIQVVGVGILYFNNNSSNYQAQFSVYQNGNLIQTFNTNPLSRAGFYFEYGFYDVTAQFLPNGAINTFVRSYLNCGNSLTFNFP